MSRDELFSLNVSCSDSVIVFSQSDEASAVQDMAESPVDTDPADAMEVSLLLQESMSNTNLHLNMKEAAVN